MTSACAMPPRPKPRAKSNVNISSGKAGCRPTSPAKRFWKSRRPTRTLTPCGHITTPRKSIVNCARHRNGLGTKPGKKSAPPCVRRHVALGGIMCGAHVRPLKSAPTVACPLARNGCGSKNHQEPPSCFVCIPQASIPCWPPSPIPNKNPCSYSPTAPNKLSCFAYPQKVLL